jgi:hypothetical protein
MLIGPVPTLLSVTGSGVLFAPMSTFPKFKLPDTFNAVAKPRRATVWGLLESESLIERDSLSGPTVVGLKATLIVQVPGASWPAQVVLVTVKSVPVVMELMVTGTLPKFVNCIGIEGAVVPSCHFPANVNEVWDTLTAGPLVANDELSTLMIEATDGTPLLFNRKSM